MADMRRVTAALPRELMRKFEERGVRCRGHWSRDLAYTISTALDVDDRRRWERDLIRYYLQKQREASAQPTTFDETWMNYRQQLFGALAWWTQTMAPSDEMQPRNTTVKFIHRITHAIDDLDALSSFD